MLCLLVTLVVSSAWLLPPPAQPRVARHRLAVSTDNNLDTTKASTNAATLRSVTFCNIPKNQEPDLLADFLMEMGAASVAVTDADAGTDREQPLFCEPDAKNTPWQDSLHWAAPVWNSCNVTALFGDATDLPWVVEMVQEAFPDQFYHNLLDHADISVVPHRDWVTHVQSSWKPIVVGKRFLLRFPWHSDEDVAMAWAAQGHNDTAKDDMIELFLQGGIAFGTGEHPTTQLCLQWLDKALPKSKSEHEGGLRVLDYGSGSGVLGLAACKLRPHVYATGVDIDVDACRIANQNAVDNDVNMLNYLPPLWLETADEDSKALWLQAHAQVEATRNARGGDEEDDTLSILWPEDEPTDNFDLCVANILAGPLITLAPTLHSMMKPGAPIGMSGILAPQGKEVVQAFKDAGFVDMKVDNFLDGWVLVTGRKPIE